MGEFEALFRTYHPVILAAAFNRLSDMSDAEDAAAEVFTLAWRRRTDHPEALTIAWLYTTLRNVVGNQYRGRARHERRLVSARDHYTAAETSVPDEAMQVRAAVLQLDVSDRELIWMAYWEDLTRDEMAQVLSCSAATLRVRLYRARKRLQEILSDAADETAKEVAWTSSN